MAWRHVCGWLRVQREFMVNQLVEGAEGAESFRKAIMVIDQALKLPDWAKQSEESARAYIRQMGEEHGS